MSDHSVREVFGNPTPSSRSWSEQVQGFGKWLEERGYVPTTVAQKLQYLAGPIRGMETRGLAITDFDEGQVELALKRHRGRISSERRRAVCHFLEYLRDRGIAAPPQPSDDSSPSARLEERYARYLAEERGLAQTTVINCRGFAGHFLVERFGQGPTLLRDLSPADVTDFLLRHLRSMSPKRAQLMGSSLRSFLRFLFLKGETEKDLSFAVPAVRQYRKSTTPRYLASADVERVLASADPTTAVGRRNRAILILLARLGLRASEIVKLELGDIHWRTGEILVRGKGSVHDRLPLPKDVGEALTLYLTRDRASCSSRRVFLRMRAPRRGFSGAAAVTTVVERAVARAGLRPPHRGAHLLRHSLATGMIRRGATMGEIAQLLRHRSLHTTELYAKVDFEGLRGVALAWPGTRGGQ